MNKELKISYWKKVNGDKEFIEIEDRLMNEMPGYFRNDPEIVCIRIGDPIYNDPKFGVRGMVVTTWIKTNTEWCKNKLDEILGSLEDWS